MAKRRLKKPRFPLRIVDRDGDETRKGVELETLRLDQVVPQWALHRAYELVPLEERRKEQRVVRAARRLIAAWESSQPIEESVVVGLEDKLAEAVEASRG